MRRFTSVGVAIKPSDVGQIGRGSRRIDFPSMGASLGWNPCSSPNENRSRLTDLDAWRAAKNMPSRRRRIPCIAWRSVAGRSWC